MHRSATLALVTVALAALAAGTFVALRGGPAAAVASGADPRLPPPDPVDASASAPPSGWDARSVVDGPLEPPVASKASPDPQAAAATDPPAAAAEPNADTLGDPSSWPAEYAGKPRSVLVEDERQLRLEHDSELMAEIDRRFREGLVTTYRRDEEPREPPRVLVSAMRGDETHVRYVWLDPSTDPASFRKMEKANWILEELRRRAKAGR